MQEFFGIIGYGQGRDKGVGDRQGDRVCKLGEVWANRIEGPKGYNMGTRDKYKCECKENGNYWTLLQLAVMPVVQMETKRGSAAGEMESKWGRVVNGGAVNRNDVGGLNGCIQKAIIKVWGNCRYHKVGPLAIVR